MQQELQQLQEEQQLQEQQELQQLQEEQELLPYMTCKMRLASNACPGWRVTGEETWPAFTQIMFGN